MLRRIVSRSIPSVLSNSASLGRGPGHQPTLDQTAKRGLRRQQLHAMRPQHPGGPAAAIAQHAEHQMLGAQVAVVEAVSFLLGQVQDPGRVLAALDHLSTSGSRIVGRRTCGVRPVW